MRFLPELFENNRRWAERMRASDPEFFERLSAKQHPKYLWIGCSDSRVPANQIVGLPPGKMFVHRNVANLCVHSDMNFLSVLHYAVEDLRVEHVIVCGHYDCGGVLAAMGDGSQGLVDNWLHHVRDTRCRHAEELARLESAALKCDRLCELNVIEQVGNLAHTSVVQKGWAEARALTIHGWIYDLKDGLLKDLGVSVGAAKEVDGAYRLKL
ncbi:MAG: carbonate dehydratase [Opitutales bacterium]|nr:carbonate dehydratase [Opitutales bacterium]